MPPPRLPSLTRQFLRKYASANPAVSTPVFQVFNRDTKRLQRSRAAANPELSRTVDYLRDTLADRLVDRLLFINRRFPRILDLGAGACYIGKHLTTPRPGRDEGTTETASERIDSIVAGELSETLLYRDAELEWNKELNMERVVLDEEHLPFENDSFDAVVSAGSMHWINDLPSALLQVNRVLKPDSPIIAAMFGGDTLYELRTSLQLAESERLGGVSPRVSPLADVRDMGGLLDKAGFSLLTIDVDDVVVNYPHAFALMCDLQAMGEGNAVLGRMKGPIPRDVLIAADAIYRALHGDEDGSLPATFRVIYMIGWKKSESQPKPLERGSGQINIKDLLEGVNKK